MTPPSMESIFLILSGVILVAGVLYWLWSHIQLTQKKVQLLENAVFELRGMLANSGGGASGGGHGAPASPTRQVEVNVPTAPSGSVTVTRTEMAGGAVADEDEEEEGWGDAPRVSVPLDALDAAPVLEMHETNTVAGGFVNKHELGSVVASGADTVPDDLQPGGRAALSAVEFADEERQRQTDDFRRLFAVQEVVEVSASAPVVPSPTRTITSVATAPASVAGAIKTPESLESMPVKELRRLAEQRGIAGAADMRKKEILAALRQQVSSTVSLTLPAPGSEAGEIKEVSIDTAAPTTEATVETETAEILE